MVRTMLLLWLSLMCVTAAAAMPEKPQLRWIGVADGLPSSTINGLALDQGGYLWLATTDGLARYDGVGMRVWRHVADDPGSLPGNYISAVHVDTANRVWVAIEGRGLSMMDARRSGFRHFNKTLDPRIGSDDVWAIASRGNALWFGTYAGGLHRIVMHPDDRVESLSRYMPVEGDPTSLPDDTVVSLEFDASARLWVGTMAGLAVRRGRAFERVALPGRQPAPVIMSMTTDGDALWVGAASGLYRWEAGRWIEPRWSKLFEAPNAAFSVVADGGGGQWIASQRKLWRVAGDSAPVPVPIGSHGPALPVYQMLKQADGALWFPVAGVGLGFLRPDWQRVAQYSHEKDGLAGELQRALAPAAAGGVWLLGSRGELERLDATGKVHPIGDRLATVLQSRSPYSIVEDAAAVRWMGSRRALLRIDANGHLRQWLAGQQDGVPDGPITLLALAPDGTLWLAASGAGIQQRDATTGRVLTDIPAGAKHGLGAVDLEAIGFDADGGFWLAGAEGMRRWNARAAVFEAPPGIVDGDRVFGFAFDGPDALWLQRLSGLEHYRRESGQWRLVSKVGTALGIPSVEGSGLLLDSRGRVWLSSLRGLFRWDPSTRRTRAFGLADGLSSREFVDRAITLRPDGVLVAALADGGVAMVDTLAGDPAPRLPALHWDRVEVRRGTGWVRLDPGAAVTLLPQDQELRVQLRLLAFDDPRENHYSTRLEGTDPGWVAQGDTGERVFARLAAGDYTLRARASDANGNAAVERVLHFKVLPPWWQTPQARSGLLLLAALLAWLLAGLGRDRVRRRQQALLAAREHAVAREASLAKTRFLATLGHEIRTPMTGVLGMTELLSWTTLDPQQRGYAESIRGAGEHLLQLLDDALDLARVESGKLTLNKQPFDLRALVAEVVALTAPLAQRKGLSFKVEVAEGLPPAFHGDVVRVRQVLLNLLGNAIKFTEQGGIALAVRPCEPGMADPPPTAIGPAGLRFEVTDTGPGLSAGQQARLFRRFEQGDGVHTAARYGGSGLGLAICQELSAAMDGGVSVHSELGAGACFRVELPLAIAAFVPAQVSITVPSAPFPLQLLLVEDDPTVAATLAGLLDAQGHRVHHAAHALAALSEVATRDFDAALLDLDLPGMDGFALARQLRFRGFRQRLLAITACADSGAEQRARAAGFDHFVRKPVTGAMLAALLLPVAAEGGPGLNGR